MKEILQGEQDDGISNYDDYLERPLLIAKY